MYSRSKTGDGFSALGSFQGDEYVVGEKAFGKLYIILIYGFNNTNIKLN